MKSESKKNQSASPPKSIGIHFGVMSDKLSVQLAEFRIPNKKLERMQREFDAINTLYIPGILTESEVKKARGRLMKDIVNAARQAVQS